MNTLPDGAVAHLPPPKARPPVRHVFGDPVTIPPEISISGCEQHERTCKNCGVVKVTVIGAGDNHFRAWRMRPDGEQVETYAALPCEAKP